jgi:hypothetical protein
MQKHLPVGRDNAKGLGERLKERVLVTVVPCLATGFLADRRGRLGIKREPSVDDLSDIYEATFTLLYRLLFLLYAEARNLLPIDEAQYYEASFHKISAEIATKIGAAQSDACERIVNAYSASEYALYDRLTRLCVAVDEGDPTLSLHRYNGGLFNYEPGNAEGNKQRAARFLAEYKVPDRYLALAIDALARDPGDKTHSLVAIDYKLLEVRHLGSIYESLLEFKLQLADEDVTTHSVKKREKYERLGMASPKRSQMPAAVVRDVCLTNDKTERKSSGSYYTPGPIVEYVVQHAVIPVLEEKLERLRPQFRMVHTTFEKELAKLRVRPMSADNRDQQNSDRELAGEKICTIHQALVEDMFDFRVIDPAMGSGHFLVAAAGCITNRLLAFLKEFPINPVTLMLDRMRKSILAGFGQQGIVIDPDMLTEVNLLKRHVLKRCIYGVDLNPMAVELAKVSLWLDAFAMGEPLSFLDHHVRCGNSLIDLEHQNESTASPAAFDAVIGNPPFLGHKGDFNAMALPRFEAVSRNCRNLAAAFLERGFRMLRDGGQLGMIIPKSVQYVESWENTRRLLSESHNLVRIADLSQAFDNVLLEQTVCIAARSPGVDGYIADALSDEGTFCGTRIGRSTSRSIGCFPARVDKRSPSLLQRILKAGPRLGEISVTSQALGYQANLNKDVSGQHFPIFRGKHIRPLRIGAATDFIDRRFLTGAGSDHLTAKVQAMLSPKVLSQNIVAHVTRPKPRAWIISAADHGGILCLNTISTTILHDDRFPIDYIVAVLNSTLASWFYTEFVFCRAIRTMHFDNYYAGKLPVADIDSSESKAFRELTLSVAKFSSRGARQRAIDDAVFDAYRLSTADRRFLIDYCYGTENVEAAFSASEGCQMNHKLPMYKADRDG